MCKALCAMKWDYVQQKLLHSPLDERDLNWWWPLNSGESLVVHNSCTSSAIVVLLSCAIYILYMYKLSRHINFEDVTFSWFYFQGSSGLFQFTDFISFPMPSELHMWHCHALLIVLFKKLTFGNALPLVWCIVPLVWCIVIAPRMRYHKSQPTIGAIHNGLKVYIAVSLNEVVIPVTTF